MRTTTAVRRRAADDVAGADRGLSFYGLSRDTPDSHNSYKPRLLPVLSAGDRDRNSAVAYRRRLLARAEPGGGRGVVRPIPPGLFFFVFAYA